MCLRLPDCRPQGQIPGDVRSTCVACAGTLLLEFGVLTRLTGNATYEAKARHAVETIYAMRSTRGLVGNTLSCDSGQWERTDAGVGAGVDSFYEYLLKASVAALEHWRRCGGVGGWVYASARGVSHTSCPHPHPPLTPAQPPHYYCRPTWPLATKPTCACSRACTRPP